jgi:integrase
MSGWKNVAPGIRYREHPTRRHGVKPDRYFVVRYQLDGKRNEEPCGWASEGWTVEKVNERLNELRKSAKSGGPKTMKEIRANIEASEAAIPSFEDILKELWERELQHKKSGKESLRLLKNDCLPVWGKKKVKTIRRRDIVLLLDDIEKRAPITRNRVHGALSRLFNFAAERGIIEDSPCVRIRKLTEKGRTRVLDDDEIRHLWCALDPEQIKPMDAYRLTKLALKVILLTGQRPGEVVGMRWAEIKDDVWYIPAERMKNGDQHNVPLTTLALETIDQARHLSGDSEFVFRSTHRDGPMSARALSRAIVSHWEAIGIKEKFTPHDLRRTVRTRLAELGIDDVIAERVLGHKLQGIMRVYNQHSYEIEKRQALEKWERKLRHIVGIEEPGKGNVIEFKRFATKR